MDFMHIEDRKKPSGTPFAVFLSDGGAPKTSRGPGKLPLSTHLWQLTNTLLVLFNV